MYDIRIRIRKNYSGSNTHILLTQSNTKSTSLFTLKVVGNEKLGGLRFLQLLAVGLGPWRSMSIFILNMPFANAKRISVSALSSKMNRRFVCD